MRERLVAWAGDCVVRGDVDVADGRISDLVNRTELLTFFGATLEALEDGHELLIDELEVERHELLLIEVEGHRGDPARRLRTVSEPVSMRVGPFEVTGNLHRAPSAPPMSPLARWQHFLPMTEVEFRFVEREVLPARKDVVLVNRERINRAQPVAPIPVESAPVAGPGPVG